MGGSRRRRRRRRRSAVEWVKNVLIVVLALSALYLAGRSGLYSDLMVKDSGGWLGRLAALLSGQAEPAPQGSLADVRPSMAAQPVRIAVYRGGERFAAQYDAAQTDRMFDVVGGLLGEGLASARGPALVSEREWRAALQQPGVYFDFLGDIPLDALYAWLGEGDSNPNLSGTARRVLLARTGGDAAALYYSNETTGLYYACETSIAYTGHLEAVLEDCGGSGASFAFEFGGGSGYEKLDPYVLIGSSAPSPRAYRGGNPLDGTDTAQLEALEQALSFVPQGNSLYPVQGGMRVREGKETLDISDSGVVTYTAAEPGASRYPVGAAGAQADSTELIEAARKLAAATAGAWGGEARLYLLELSQEEDGTAAVRFGYSLDGAAVYLQGDPCAASFTIQNGWITSYTLRLRTYEDTGERSLVMRELQAAAALDALAPQGKELALYYEDNGGELVQAAWGAR